MFSLKGNIRIYSANYVSHKYFVSVMAAVEGAKIPYQKP